MAWPRNGAVKGEDTSGSSSGGRSGLRGLQWKATGVAVARGKEGLRDFSFPPPVWSQTVSQGLSQEEGGAAAFFWPPLSWPVSFHGGLRCHPLPCCHSLRCSPKSGKWSRPPRLQLWLRLRLRLRLLFKPP
eukprot:GGOE01004862.1.p4 GENE.GGOE01004862.1~~GGOE01004862.1.p4  ORF type:complete len:131 (-),score=7.07 GGOE01004862.1:733-1125(-)